MIEILSKLFKLKIHLVWKIPKNEKYCQLITLERENAVSYTTFTIPNASRNTPFWSDKPTLHSIRGIFFQSSHETIHVWKPCPSLFIRPVQPSTVSLRFLSAASRDRNLAISRARFFARLQTVAVHAKQRGKRRVEQKIENTDKGWSLFHSKTRYEFVRRSRGYRL